MCISGLLSWWHRLTPMVEGAFLGKIRKQKRRERKGGKKSKGCQGKEKASYRAADIRPIATQKAKAPRTLWHTGIVQVQVATFYLPYLFMWSFLKKLQMFLRLTFADNIRVADQLSTVGITGDMGY